MRMISNKKLYICVLVAIGLYGRWAKMTDYAQFGPLVKFQLPPCNKGDNGGMLPKFQDILFGHVEHGAYFVQ